MSKSYLEICEGVASGAAALREAIPGQMASFSKLGAESYRDAALTAKTKELIALAIGVTVRCDGCVSHHAKAVLDRGATREEVAEAIGVAIHMGGGPSMVYGAEALRAYDEFSRSRSGSSGG